MTPGLGAIWDTWVCDEEYLWSIVLGLAKAPAWPEVFDVTTY